MIELNALPDWGENFFVALKIVGIVLLAYVFFYLNSKTTEIEYALDLIF